MSVSRSGWNFENTKAGYRNLWKSATIKPSDAVKVNKATTRVLAGEAQYKEVQRYTGVPWFFIGALHMRESACDFEGVLHNGDRIIGTGRLTYRVPKGRGPFATWADSAVDALRIKQLDEIDDWTIERMLYCAENFNGLGYALYRGVNSPYVWASTTKQERGKYTSDGHWDPNAWDEQTGVAAILKRLCELRPEINLRLNTFDALKPKPAPAPEPFPPPPDIPKPEPKQPRPWWMQLLDRLLGR